MNQNLKTEVKEFLTEAKQQLREERERINGRPARGPIDGYEYPTKKFQKGVTTRTANPRLGSVLKGIVTGNWGEAEEEKRAIGGTSDAAGGYLLPLAIAQEVIDFARAKSVCMDAGASTLLLDTGNVRIPRIASDPVGTWKMENDYLVPTNITFDAVDFKAHTLTANVRCSIELFEDSELVNELMASTMMKALGLQLDQAILRGSGAVIPGVGMHTGTNTPLGIRFTPNVNLVDAAARRSRRADYSTVDFQRLSNYMGSQWNTQCGCNESS